MSDLVWRIEQTAAALGFTVEAVRSHLKRNSGAVPRPFKLGRAIAWRPEDVRAFIATKAAAAAYDGAPPPPSQKQKSRPGRKREASFR